MRKIQVGCGLLCLITGAVFAGDAVDGLNGSLGFAIGNMESEWGNNLSGSFALPLSGKFGLQVDGLYTQVSDRDFAGGGLHAFWRDSERGSVGLTAAGISQEFLYGLNGGMETEYYLKRFTFGLEAGVATLEYSDSVPFIDTHPTDFIGTATVSYYPLDDLVIQAAYSRVLGNNLYEALVEYQTPLAGLDCFVDLAKGDNDYDHALFGVRYHLGHKKSLIRRHREDDRPSAARRVLNAIGTYGAEYNRAGREYTAAHGGEWTGSFGALLFEAERNRWKEMIEKGVLPPLPPLPPSPPPSPPPPGL